MATIRVGLMCCRMRPGLIEFVFVVRDRMDVADRLEEHRGEARVGWGGRAGLSGG